VGPKILNRAQSAQHVGIEVNPAEARAAILVIRTKIKCRSAAALDFVLEIDVDKDEIIQRMSGRRVHPGSGRVYHVKFNPPKVAGRDDVTGEPLIQRDDDKEETVRKRLEVYYHQTRPLVDYYSKWATQDAARAPKYRKISGVGSVGEIRERVFAALK